MADDDAEKQKLPPIDRLQPLGWQLADSFNPSVFGSAYGLQLPPSWVESIKTLAEVDRTPPVLGLYATLRGCAPDIIYAFPNSFSSVPEKRPPFWLISLSTGGVPKVQQLWGIIKTWMRENYELDVVRSVAARMEPALSEMKWEPINLQTASTELLRVILPELIARALVKSGFKLGLTDGKGHTEEWDLVVSPTLNDDTATLVSWQPIEHRPAGKQESQLARYSYYLRFSVAPPSGKMPMLLLFKAGIRRYVTRPMANWDNSGGKPMPSAGQRISLPRNEKSSVYMAVQGLSWLHETPTLTAQQEITLVGLSLVRYETVHWQGRINRILSQVASSLDIPEPLTFLSSPNAYAPQFLMSYRTRFGNYSVKSGIEAADRYELFGRLSQSLLEAGMIPAPPIQKIDFGGITKKRLSKPKVKAAGSQQPYKGTYRIRFSANSAPTLVSVLREFLTSKEVKGQIEELENNSLVFTNALLHRYLLRIETNPLPVAHYSSLQLQGQRSAMATATAIRSRASQIEMDLRSTPLLPGERWGIVIEMLDYRQFKGAARLEDPKPGVRWGYAYSNWVSQFITPEPEYLDPEAHRPSNPDDERQMQKYRGKLRQLEKQQEGYRARCLNSILDLLRQLSFPVGIPFYTGFNRTDLPEAMDIYGIYILRLNARHRGESKIVLPLVIRITAKSRCCDLEVCLPGEAGPIWMPYYDALIAMSRLERGRIPDYTAEQIQTFVQCVFRDIDMDNPILLLIDDQNLRKDLPSLTQVPPVVCPDANDNPWRTNNILPVKHPEQLRVARLRSSNDGLVNDVCPLSGFNRYSGIYQNPKFSDAFFSIGRSPQSAKRPANARQRDRVEKPGWNQSALEITWLCLQPGDRAEEWTLVIHRLREASPFINSEIVTALPQPLHSGRQLKEYVSRLDFEQVPGDEEEIELEEEEVEIIQLSLF